MNKAKYFLTLGVCMITFAANANVSFKWSSVANEALNFAGGYLIGGSTVFTFITSDSTINFDSLIALQNTYGDDAFVQASTTPAAPLGTGRYTTATMTLGVAGNGAGSYVGSYAYFLLVETPYYAGITPGSIAAGTHYAVSPISPQALNWYDNPSPQTPQVFDVGIVQTSGTVVAVPEPSTVALMLAGLGVLGFARMRRK